MNKTSLLIACAWIVIANFDRASLAQELQGLEIMKNIAPLKDNRRSIRKLLGDPTLTDSYSDYFNVEEGKLEVVYNTGKCSRVLNYGSWNVEGETVIRVNIHIHKNIEFASLKLNLSDYKREIPSDTPDLTIFTNKKTGIQYVQFQKYLSDVRIFPSKSQSFLKCEE